METTGTPREDILGSDPTELVCGASMTLEEFCQKFWVNIGVEFVIHPRDIVTTNMNLAKLFWDASREKAKAQAKGNARDIKLLNTVIENLDFARKCLNTATWARSVEAKVITNE